MDKKVEISADISIHAPAKGATGLFCRTARLMNYFNPRSREGSDDISKHNGVVNIKFQSTLPRRERLNLLRIQLKGDEISIHAPAKGATMSRVKKEAGSDISIHAPAKGATKQRLLLINPKLFQSTLPRRERRGKNSSINYNKNFNPRSREGSDGRCAAGKF